MPSIDGNLGTYDYGWALLVGCSQRAGWRDRHRFNGQGRTGSAQTLLAALIHTHASFSFLPSPSSCPAPGSSSASECPSIASMMDCTRHAIGSCAEASIPGGERMHMPLSRVASGRQCLCVGQQREVTYLARNSRTSLGLHLRVCAVYISPGANLEAAGKAGGTTGKTKHDCLGSRGTCPGGEGGSRLPGVRWLVTAPVQPPAPASAEEQTVPI